MSESKFRDDLIRALTRAEGTKKKNGRHVLYKDSVGKWTVGHGRNLEDRGLSDREADFLFQNDLDDALSDVKNFLPWSVVLNDARRGVLVELSFNLGIGRLVRKNPKMLAALKVGDYVTAKAELLDGPYKEQVGERAFRLADQLESGVWA